MTERECACFKCNKCWTALAAGEGARGFCTPCNHVYCAQCSKQVSAAGRCPACSTAVESGPDGLTPLEGGADLALLSRRLGVFPTDAITQAAAAALALVSYQEQLDNAKKKQNEKAQLKKIVDQSKAKIQELQEAAQKATVKCKEAMRGELAANQERDKLKEYIRKKSELSRQLKGKIAQLSDRSERLSDLGSDCTSEGQWETVMHEEVYFQNLEFPEAPDLIGDFQLDAARGHDFPGSHATRTPTLPASGRLALPAPGDGSPDVGVSRGGPGSPSLAELLANSQKHVRASPTPDALADEDVAFSSLGGSKVHRRGSSSTRYRG